MSTEVNKYGILARVNAVLLKEGTLKQPDDKVSKALDFHKPVVTREGRIAIVKHLSTSEMYPVVYCIPGITPESTATLSGKVLANSQSFLQGDLFNIEYPLYSETLSTVLAELQLWEEINWETFGQEEAKDASK